MPKKAVLIMFWHIETDIISLLVMAAIYLYSTRVQANNEQALPQRRFRWCLQVGLLVTVVDVAASLAMEMPVSAPVYHLLMTTYMVVIELVIVTWFYYAVSILYHDDSRRARRMAILGGLPYALYVPLALSTPWTGLIYSLGPGNAYTRGPLFSLMVVVYAIYALALFLLVFLRRRHLPPGYSLTILLLTPLVLALAIAVQLLHPGWLMILPGYMFSMVTSFLFLQTRRLRDSQALLANLSRAALTDGLTGLYNRAGMEYLVQQRRV